MELLAEELKTYETHRLELAESQAGKFVLIKGRRIIGVFDTELDAVRQGIERFKTKPFFVREITVADTPIYVSSHLVAV